MRCRSYIAALVTAAVFGAIFLVRERAEPLASAAKEEPKTRKARPEGKPVAMPANPVGVQITLGVKDEEPTFWEGDIKLSEGRILEFTTVRANPAAEVSDNHFKVRTIRPMQQQMRQNIMRPILRLSVDAPATATVTVTAKHGDSQDKFTIALGKLVHGTPQRFLDGQALVERQDAGIRLTKGKTENDYPALASGKNGAAWLAYVEYQPGPPIVNERVQNGNFDLLVPKDNGDQVLLSYFDGKEWKPVLDVTEPGLRVWRPTVAVDGKGDVVVAWSQQVDDDWEIFYRRYTPGGKGDAAGKWSDAVRLTNEKGSDFGVVAATDARGTVWLAWQAWRDDNFDIMLAALKDDHAWSKPRAISGSKANDWSPAIAADSRGNVFVAWDTYDKGNYDVRLLTVDKEGKSRSMAVADSARFEARPHVVCDAKDRLWIVYEEGDEQWGKDYANQDYKKIGLKGNPGYALYINRTVKVKCVVDGKLMQPAGDLEAAFKGKLSRNKSMPRLAVDKAGGVWLLLRHHPFPGGVGEVWSSYALRYDGKVWSAPRRLQASENLLDNRPGLAPFRTGILTVFSTDHRFRTQNRGQDDLYATVLEPTGKTASPELAPNQPAPVVKVPVVHPREKEDIATIRDHRVETGGKKLQLIRGEFHRHTEISAHRDGDGMLEDAYRYALDAADLDWIGIGDHDNGFGQEYMWWIMQKMTELHHNPKRFVAVHTYERSIVYPDGHRNVIMPRRGIRPLPRGDMKGTEEKGTPDTKVLYAYMKHFGGMCASHTSATQMGTDWRDNNREVEPVVEIYQGLRHNYERPDAPRAPTQETNIGGFRPKGFINNALEKGYRFGFQCSSDHISTHISYAVVLTDDDSRQGIIDAFKKRHSYGATDNIVLVVRSGDHLMGDEFTTDKRPTLEINVIGTRPIAKLHVVRDNKYVYEAEPNKREVNMRYTDMDATKGKTSYYYVRIEQVDGNIAWASPMWIAYKP
jgi:hypothetical protein